MVREFQIRGSYETIFFAEKNLTRSSIHKLELHQTNHKKLVKSKVYELRSRLVAMERDNDPINFQNNTPSLYILGEDQIVSKIQQDPSSGSYICTKSYDYKEHQLTALIDLDWSQCHISGSSITYDDVTFQVNSDHPNATPAQKAYFWNE